MPRPPQRPLYVAVILERQDNHVLIALADEGDVCSRPWCFPRGLAGAGESPEAAVRRVAREALGIEVEIVVGQPPLSAELDGELADVRYFFCGLLTDEEPAGPYAEIRWVARAHLREYAFDAASGPVVDWLLE